MNIVLLGFMGTGKTAVGRVLAGKLKMRYVDIDTEIEKRENKKISEIFEKSGEKRFRELEKKMVSEISGRDNQVISAGGGVVLNQENIANLEKNGFLICLDAEPSVIYERTHRYIHRPLLEKKDPKKEIKELLNRRAPFYAKIKNHIDTSNLDIFEVAEKIIGIYKKHEKK